MTDLPGYERAVIRKLLRDTIELVEEKYDPARFLAAHRLFERFGLGDASVAAYTDSGVISITSTISVKGMRARSFASATLSLLGPSK